MVTLNSSATMLVQLVEAIRIGPIQPVGEPHDDSIPWQRVVHITMFGTELELILLAEDRAVLEQLDCQR